MPLDDDGVAAGGGVAALACDTACADGARVGIGTRRDGAISRGAVVARGRTSVGAFGPPTSASSYCSARSRAVLGRSLGSFARQVWTTASIAGGTSTSRMI